MEGRYFDGGAFRDGDNGKMDFEGYFSPLVIKGFGEYMLHHQKQSDGQMRDSDNWQKGFGEDHIGVCLKSLLRHVHDIWMEYDGYPSRDGMEEAVYGSMFNIMAIAYKLEKDKYEK